MEGQPGPDALAAKAVPVDTLLSMLNAAFSQFLSPEIVGKTILAAGRAAGIDDATLKAKLYAMGAVVKDEQAKGGKVKKPKGEGKGKGMSLYALFLTKHCAETRAEDAKHPLAPGEKRDGNRLKEAISAWSDLDKNKFEEQYGDLVRELKERQQKGEKIDVAGEIAKFELARGMGTSAVAKARRQPDEPAGAKPAKKAKVEAGNDEDDEDESDDEDDSGAANGNNNAKKAAESSSEESGTEESEESEDEAPAPPKAAPTPTKGKKPAAAPVKAAAKVKAEPVKAKGDDGKKKEKKEKKVEKKK